MTRMMRTTRIIQERMIDRVVKRGEEGEEREISMEERQCRSVTSVPNYTIKYK
jgi:hypothetical protein